MRQDNQIDLRTEGGLKAVTLAPGVPVNYSINAQQSRVGAGGGGRGLYNYVRRANFQVSFTVSRGAASEAPIYPDAFPKVIGSLNWWTPLFGTWYDPQVCTGPVLKHIVELHANAYQYETYNRAPIPAGLAAAVTRSFEFSVPCGGWMTNQFPDHFDHWLGWLDTAFIEIYAAAAGVFGDDTTLTNLTIQGQLETVPFGEILIPPFVLLRRYTQAAAGTSAGPTLVGVGGGGSMEGTDDAARLMGLFFAHNAGGLTGSGTADEITSMALPWRDQAQTTLPAGFFQRYLNVQRYAQMGAFTQTIGADNAMRDVRPLYDMDIVSANEVLNNAAARYTPLVWPIPGDLVSQYQKVKGNYPIEANFNAEQDGLFTVYALEVKQYNRQKCAEMLAAMGIDPSKVKLVPKLGRKNKGAIDPDKLFCLPRSVEAL